LNTSADRPFTTAPAPALLRRPRRHNSPSPRQIHPRRLLATQPRRRAFYAWTALGTTVRDARLAGRRPQRPLRASPLAPDLLSKRPPRQPCHASLGDRGLERRSPAAARVAGGGGAFGAAAGVRGRRAGGYEGVGQAEGVKYGRLRAHAHALARVRPAIRRHRRSGALAGLERPRVDTASDGAGR
jgi:hypothetical protein